MKTSPFSKRHRPMLLMALLSTALAGPAFAGFSLGIMQPVCALVPSVSKEIAMLIAVLGIAFVMGSIWMDIKGPQIVVGVIKLALIVVGLVGLIPLATAAFPSLGGAIC